MLKDRIRHELQQAMKAKNTVRTNVLRMVLAEISKLETSGQKNVDPAAAVATYAKRLDKSIEEYAALGQTEQVETLRAERAIVAEFLPRKLSAEETDALVDRLLAAHPELTSRDVGPAMKLIMADHRDQVDGKLVQELVRRKLAAR